MGLRVTLGVLVLCLSQFVFGESSRDQPVKNIYVLRGAVNLATPQMNYRLVEWAQVRGRWVVPDIGYHDTGDGQDQLWFAAVGRVMVQRPRVSWLQQVYFAQEAGPKARSQRSMWLWPIVDVNMPRRLAIEVVPYPTVPLDAAQRWGFNIDRAKLERVGQRWNWGAGYQGGIYGGQDWVSKPFVLVTRKSRMGALETWWQRLPDGAQMQLRYRLASGAN